MKIAYRALVLFMTLSMLAFSFIAAPLPAFADDDVITISDAGLRAAIEANLGKGPGEDIYRSEMESITTLDAAEYGIASIADIQYCINLVNLYINNNVLQNLTGLGACTNLQVLHAHENQLTDISAIQTCTGLKTLYIYLNQVPSIAAVAPLTSLEDIMLCANPFTDISPLAGHTSLYRVWCNYSQITDFSFLAGFNNLQVLYIGHNQVSDIDFVEYLPALTDLNLSSNIITDITPLVNNGGITGAGDTVLLENNLLDTTPGSDDMNDIDALLARGVDLSYLPQDYVPPPSTYTLSVTANPPGAGTVDKTPDEASYDSGDTVSLDPQPASGYVFSHWSGDLSGSDDPANVTMNSDKSIIANFVPNTVSLTVVITGNGDVTVTPEKSEYNIGEVVQLEADADSGWDFSHWVGNVADTDDSETSITMNNAETVTAVFIEETGEVVTIPDFHLEACIRAAINKPAGDLFRTDLEGVTTLNGVMQDIHSISGLEYCTNLEVLMLCFNDISDISPLTNLTKLRVLWVTSNPHLSDITPLAGLNQLIVLKLSSNVISDISALIANSGLTGSGDWVVLTGNLLDLTAGSDDMQKIQELLGRGIHVLYSSTQFSVTVTIEPAGAGTVTQADSTSPCDLLPSVRLTATPSSGWVFSGWSGGASGSDNSTTVVFYENVAVTATFVEDPAGGTPGGGNPGGGTPGGGFTGDTSGGGGASTDPYKRVTGLRGFILDNGLVIDDFEAFSVDEWVRLLLPANTTALNSAGAYLPLIIIEKLDVIPPGIPGDALVGGVYSFSPEGATFTPHAILTLRYDPLLLPPGAKEENIKFVWWDEDAEEWVELDSVVDTVKHTVTVFIEHFSTYSLTVDVIPATFEVTDVSLTSDVLEKGETAIAKVSVTNTGDLPGNFRAVLQVNGALYQEKLAALASGEKTELTFFLSFENSGTYSIDINGVNRVVTVKPSPASFMVDGLSIAPLSGKPGEDVQVKFTVFNSGEASGDYTVNCLLDGEICESQKVQVSGYSNKEVTFTLSSLVTGMHNIAINEALSGSFEVKAVEAMVTAPAVTADEPVTTSPAATTAAPTTDTGKTGNNIGMVLLIVAGVLLVIVIFSIIMITRAKKKQI